MQQRRTLRVAIDTLSIQPVAGGIRVYLRELVSATPTDAEVDLLLICSRSNVASFADLPNVRIIRIPWPTRNRWLRVLTQQLIVPWLVLTHRADVLFAPVDIAPVASPAPIVTCIHSSHINAQEGHAGFVQRYYNRALLALTLRRSRAVVAISHYVRQATEQMFPLAKGKFTVIYHGGGIVERAARAGWTVPESGARDAGILFVGTLHRHKRADILVRAYAKLRRTHAARLPPLLIVGDDRGGTAAWLRELANSEGIADHVFILGRISDAELLELYSTCSVLVVPSAIEGFGLPVVEAMQAGLPVVVVNLCALPEIAAGAACVVDPGDESALEHAIEGMLWDSQRRAAAVAAGLARGSHFQWSRCAGETLSVLKAAARS